MRTVYEVRTFDGRNWATDPVLYFSKARAEVRLIDHILESYGEDAEYIRSELDHWVGYEIHSHDTHGIRACSFHARQLNMSEQ